MNTITLKPHQQAQKATLEQLGLEVQCVQPAPLNPEGSEAWFDGTLEHGGIQYGWSAKIYPDGSNWGVQGSAVSKLTVVPLEEDGFGDFSRAVLNYDRGWDVNPPSSAWEFWVARLCAAVSPEIMADCA